jgi:hypothetical protein
MICIASTSMASMVQAWERSFSKNGRIYGSDTEGVRFDGEYLYDERAGLADVKIKVTVQPKVMTVFGVSNPYEWSFDVTSHLNPKKILGGSLSRPRLDQPSKLTSFIFETSRTPQRLPSARPRPVSGLPRAGAGLFRVARMGRILVTRLVHSRLVTRLAHVRILVTRIERVCEPLFKL